MTRILILSLGDDGFAAELAAAGERLAPGAFVHEPCDPLGGTPSDLTYEHLTLGGIDLETLGSVFVYGLAYQDPVLPAAADNLDWGLWQSRYVLEQQGFSHLYSLLSELAARGVAVFNPVEALIANYAKPALFGAAAKARLKVPDWLCGNDPEEARAFAERHDLVLWRPATGRAAWQVFRAKQRRALIGTERPPVLLAEAREGTIVRAFCLDGRVLLTLALEAPDTAEIERLERFLVADRPYPENAAARIMKATAARFSVVLATFDPGGPGVRGAPCLYDVEAAPLLGGLPPEIRDFLAERLALGLLGRFDEATAPPGLGPDASERESLFLRRMLRIQFDIEATKHREE